MLSDGSEEVWTAVRKLPKRQAQVLALAFLEDMSVAQIVTVLVCGEETVRTHLRRGRTALADRLSVTDASGTEGKD